MSKTHTTIRPVVEGRIPEGFHGADAETIQRIAWAESTGSESFDPFDAGTFAFMAKVFKTVQSPEYWKAPFQTVSPVDEDGNDLREWVVAAAQWYFAETPKVYPGADDPKLVLIESKGYQAW